MCLKSIGFWNSIAVGIIRSVTKSQAVHMSLQSSIEGIPNLVVWSGTTDGESSRGNANGGRSKSQSE